MDKEVEVVGRWRDQLGQDLPLVLELACGRGEYSLALGADNPDKLFIGVDIKGARIWQGASHGIDRGLANIAFLRTRIELIHRLFGPEEVDEIWVTFPDPFLRESKANRRLTSPAFLDRYKHIIKPGGTIHLKTDDDTLYHYTLDAWRESDLVEVLYEDYDIYGGPLEYPELAHKTYYEVLKGEGKTIKYIRGRFLPTTS
jgi:tRNA (guanine-N7-)-methyltransferase